MDPVQKPEDAADRSFADALAAYDAALADDRSLPPPAVPDSVPSGEQSRLQRSFAVLRLIAQVRPSGPGAAPLPRPSSPTPLPHGCLSRTLNLEADAGNGARQALSEASCSSAVESESRQPLPSTSVVVGGRYQLGGVLGQGGIGVVYSGRDVKLHRRVAVKMLSRLDPLRATDCQRFRAEAEAIARLQHPNIIEVHDFGTHQLDEMRTRPFLVMEHAEGGSLEQRLAGQPQAPVFAARLLATLARAIHIAHEKGIVHRDLKPANIVYTASGVPKITDFGLAKCLEEAVSLTRTGEVLGTPQYIAPEQARGEHGDVSPATDIYALGAILYEMLTGRPPFQGIMAMDIALRVICEEPMPPARLQPGVPRDLETICLKCLHKSPARRYATALALADDLDRYLAGARIEARPTGMVERLANWTRQRPGLAAALAVLTLAVVAVLVVVVSYHRRLEEEGNRARQGEALAAGERDAALKARAAVEQARRDAEAANADYQEALGWAAERRGELLHGALWFAHALPREGDSPQREAALRTRWHSLTAASPVPWRAFRLLGEKPPRRMGLHPDARWLWISTAAHTLLWDLEKEAQAEWPGPSRTVTAAAWNPDGRLLALGSDGGRVDLFRFPDGQAVRSWQLPGRVSTLAFDGSGKRLAFASDRLRAWDLEANQFVTPELPHPAPVLSVAFSRKGDRIVTACQDCTARVFALAGEDRAAQPLLGPVSHGQKPASLPVNGPPGFLADDDGLLTSTADGVFIHRFAPGEKPRQIKAAGLRPYGWVSPNGQFILTRGVGREPDLWDAQGQQRLPFQVGGWQQQGARENVFSPDSCLVLSRAADTVRLLATDGGPPGPALWHGNHAMPFTFAAGGCYFATGQEDGLVRVWRLGQAGPLIRRVPLTPGEFSNLFALSPSGRHFLAADSSGPDLVRVYEASTGTPVGPAVNVGTPPAKGALTAGTFAFAVTRADGKGRLHGFQGATGKCLFDAIDLPFEPAGPTCSPDGRILVVFGLKGRGQIRDAKTGALQAEFDTEGAVLESRYPSGNVCFSPDGKRIVTFGITVQPRLWSVADGRPGVKLTHSHSCLDARFSPDGQWVVTSAYDERVRVFDAHTGQLAAEPLRHSDVVFTTRFDPSGERLLTSCRNGEVRLWNWRTGRLEVQPLVHDAEVSDAAFSVDGSRIATATVAGDARIWDAVTGRPLTASWRLHRSAREPRTVFANRVEFSPDGQRLFIAVRTHDVCLFDLSELGGPAPAQLPSQDLLGLAELNAGGLIDPIGGVVPLTTDEWLNRWKAFRQKYPQFHSLANLKPRD